MRNRPQRPSATPVLLAAAVSALALASLPLAACSSPSAEPATAPPGSSAPAAQAPGAPGVDPQILSDVVAAVFPVPGPSQVRTIRVLMASIALPNIACGGKGFADPNATEMRMDQARYADLELIAEKGLAEKAQDKPRLRSADCREQKAPALKEWPALESSWSDVTRTAALSDAVTKTHTQTTSCLKRQTGLKVNESDPTATYLSSADGAMAQAEADGLKGLEHRLSAAFVTCTREYFQAIGVQLAPERARLVERNREVLQRSATELSALGYVP